MAGEEVMNGAAVAEESREKLVFHSLCMDFIILIPETAAVILSGSATLFADVIKCANEVLATTFALLIIRRVTRGGKFAYDYGMGKFESLTRIITGGVMFVSLVILFLLTFHRIVDPEHFDMDAAIIGIPLMILASIADSYHWQKNYRIVLHDPSPIMESQWRLRRAKAFANISVLLALGLSFYPVGNAWVVYIDPAASFVIIGFLLHAGYREISSSLPDLFDKTREEERQILILREHSSSFDKYNEFHAVRSCRSGSTISIEIFLEFDPEQKQGEVQEYIDSLKGSLEAQIPGSLIWIIPTSAKDTRSAA